MNLATEFLSFVNSAPTPYHAVSSICDILLKAGFHRLSESQDWSKAISPGSKYFVTRNGSSVIAFAIGCRWLPGNPISIVGAHTDSPCLRIKPVSKRTVEGYLQVGVETYGGGIWHSWFDRDLSVAGRVMIENNDGSIEQRLVKIKKPLLRIPTLAIHLDRSVMESFKFNNETHLTPILGTVSAQLGIASVPASVATEATCLAKMADRHHLGLVQLVANELHLDSFDSIIDFELLLYDVQEATIGGLNDEFIFASRLDNLGMTFAAVRGLVDSLSDVGALREDDSIRIACCFDHEEIGSLSAQGADSNFLPSILRRLALVNGQDSTESSAIERSYAKSFFLSADMAHAVNPNYASKYESEHKPAINGGPVIKVNANQRYATNSPGIVLLQKIANEASLKLQLFVVRQDSPCGGTIGPMLSAKLGIRTLDIGNPQLSMHSIRETSGTQDVGHAVLLFQHFYSRYPQLSRLINIEGN